VIAGLNEASPMNPKFSSGLPIPLSAPCIVENGIVFHKTDMLRLLKGLHRVRYVHRQDSEITNSGEGCVMEVFSDPTQATIVANRSLYLNVHSFDYLELITDGHKTAQEIAPQATPEAVETTCFALVQDNRCLCLTPLPNLEVTPAIGHLDTATLEAIVTEALSASWDASLDDERNLP